jgi:hypothetical protein
VFDVTQPDDRLSASDAKELAQDQIDDLPLLGIEGYSDQGSFCALTNERE